LHLNGQAGGDMSKHDASGGFVYFLAAGSGGADEFFPEVVFFKAASLHLAMQFGEFFFGDAKINHGLPVLLIYTMCNEKSAYANEAFFYRAG